MDATLTSLISVVVGGMLTLAGGWLGPWLLEGRKEAAEKKKRRVEKFEEMVAALFEYEHWLNVIRDTNLFENETTIVPTSPPSPFARLHAISAVYFPELETKIMELELAGDAYVSWIFEARQQKLKGIDEYVNKYGDVYEAFLKVLKRVLAEFRAYAKGEFQ